MSEVAYRFPDTIEDGTLKEGCIVPYFSKFYGWFFSHLFRSTLILLTPCLRWSTPRSWNLLASLITPIVWIGLKRRRRVAIANIESVLHVSRAEAIAIGKQSFHSNIMVLFETLCLSRLLAEDGVTVETTISPGAEKIIAGLKSGEIKMALALSSHSGVWEFTGASIARLVSPMTTVVASKLPRNPILGDYLKKVRAEAGLLLIDRGQVSRHLLKQKQAGTPFLNVFLCDQHFNREGGVRADFLGRPACTVSIPATLITKYKTPVIVGHCSRKAVGHYVMDFDTLEIEEFNNLDANQAREVITTRINDMLSTRIMRTPEQWTWGHRRWRECCDSGAGKH